MRRFLNICVLLIGFIVLTVGSEAFASFVHTPPIGQHNFPGTYTDGNGLSLQPCLNTGGACGPAAEVPTSFPNPVIYWEAQARMPTYGGKGGNPSPFRPGGQATATLTMILAGAFVPDANGDPIITEGNQYVMQSLSIKIDSLLDGASYTVTTPFGVFNNLTATYDSRRNVDSIKETFEFPFPPTAGSFDQSTLPTTPYSVTPTSFASFPGMDRFLTCAGGPQTTEFLGLQDPGTGGLVECDIAGSPIGSAFNVFRIEGPEVGGGSAVHTQLQNMGTGDPDFTCDDTTGSCLPEWTGPSVDSIQTTNFTIIGQVSTVPTASVLGDMNGDFNVTVADAPLLVEALVNRPAYDAHLFPVNPDVNGDVNQDGTFDLGDTGAFSMLLGGPTSATSVPEPSAFLLALFALAGVAWRRRADHRNRTLSKVVRLLWPRAGTRLVIPGGRDRAD